MPPLPASLPQHLHSGAQVYKNIDPEFSKLLLTRAEDAFRYGLEHPGACQTAPGTAPYFYEEDNWIDDMELAAIELYKATREPEYLDHAVDFGRKEIVTPWMGADTARHYQWYPFINMGHPGIVSSSEQTNLREEFLGNMKEGLEKVKSRGENNPFLIGIPFIWCSNNLVTATLTQASLYKKLSGDEIICRNGSSSPRLAFRMQSVGHKHDRRTPGKR